MRRTSAPKRDVLPDPVYNSVILTKFINQVMLDGKKGVAERIVYGAFEIIKDKTGKDPMEVFDEAMKNVMPVLEVKARRVGGANYQVPVEVRPERRQTLGIRWLVINTRKRGGKTMQEKLAAELMDAANNVKTLVGKCVPNGVVATADAAGTDISGWWNGTASSGSLVSGDDTNANTKAVKALEDAITAAEATILASTKTNATATVTAYEKDAIAAMTAGTEKTAIETAKSTADSAIESADTVAAVNSAVAAYKAAVDLNLAKYNAKADAAAYKGAGYNELSPEQKTEADAAIATLKTAFDSAVASADTTAAINTLLTGYKEDVDEAVAAAKLTKLTEIAVTLAATAETGATIPTTATVTSTPANGAAFGSISWAKDGQAVSGTTFADAGTYTATITVTIAEGYAFVNGTTAVKVNGSGGTMTNNKIEVTVTVADP